MSLFICSSSVLKLLNSGVFTTCASMLMHLDPEHFHDVFVQQQRVLYCFTLFAFFAG